MRGGWDGRRRRGSGASKGKSAAWRAVREAFQGGRLVGLDARVVEYWVRTAPSELSSRKRKMQGGDVSRSPSFCPISPHDPRRCSPPVPSRPAAADDASLRAEIGLWPRGSRGQRNDNSTEIWWPQNPVVGFCGGRAPGVDWAASGGATSVNSSPLPVRSSTPARAGRKQNNEVVALSALRARVRGAHTDINNNNTRGRCEKGEDRKSRSCFIVYMPTWDFWVATARRWPFGPNALLREVTTTNARKRESHGRTKKSAEAKPGMSLPNTVAGSRAHRSSRAGHWASDSRC